MVHEYSRGSRGIAQAARRLHTAVQLRLLASTVISQLANFKFEKKNVPCRLLLKTSRRATYCIIGPRIRIEYGSYIFARYSGCTSCSSHREPSPREIMRTASKHAGFLSHKVRVRVQYTQADTRVHTIASYYVGDAQEALADGPSLNTHM